MITNEKITSLFAQNNGILKVAKAMENGVPKPAFYAYMRKHGTERVAQGVYLSPDAWTDATYLLCLRCSQAIFSHRGALSFHDLVNRESKSHSVTAKAEYNPTDLREDDTKVYTIKKELHGVEVVSMNTPFGNSIPVYDVEHTICDATHNRSGIGMQIWQDALRQYIKCQHRDLRKLMCYARIFHVEKLLWQYLGVLL